MYPFSFYFPPTVPFCPVALLTPTHPDVPDSRALFSKSLRNALHLTIILTSPHKMDRARIIHSARTVPAQCPLEKNTVPVDSLILTRWVVSLEPWKTKKCGHCVFFQRALCGHCTGTVRALLKTHTKCHVGWQGVGKGEPGDGK